jgi:hypothetical protein
LYICAVASHEGMAIMFPAYGVALLAFDPRPDGRLRRAVLRTAPLAAIGLATALSFQACQCNEGSEVWGTEYAWRQTQIYLGRLLYPVGLELPNDVSTSHAAAAAVLGAMMVAACIFGPPIARVGTLWVLLAVAPHVFIEYFTASRYLYLPAPGLAMLFAALAVMLASALSRVRPSVLAAGGVVAAAVLFGWYAYQTVRQDEHFADATTAWERYHNDVTRAWPSVPPGTRVVTVGGPFQKVEYQYFVLPAFAETTWGEGRSLQDYEPGSLPAQIAINGGGPYVGVYRDGELVPLAPGDGGR